MLSCAAMLQFSIASSHTNQRDSIIRRGLVIKDLSALDERLSFWRALHNSVRLHVRHGVSIACCVDQDRDRSGTIMSMAPTSCGVSLDAPSWHKPVCNDEECVTTSRRGGGELDQEQKFLSNPCVCMHCVVTNILSTLYQYIPRI